MVPHTSGLQQYCSLVAAMIPASMGWCLLVESGGGHKDLNPFRKVARAADRAIRNNP